VTRVSVSPFRVDYTNIIIWRRSPPPPPPQKKAGNILHKFSLIYFSTITIKWTNRRNLLNEKVETGIITRDQRTYYIYGIREDTTTSETYSWKSLGEKCGNWRNKEFKVPEKMVEIKARNRKTPKHQARDIFHSLRQKRLIRSFVPFRVDYKHQPHKNHVHDQCFQLKIVCVILNSRNSCIYWFLESILCKILWPSLEKWRCLRSELPFHRLAQLLKQGLRGNWGNEEHYYKSSPVLEILVSDDVTI